MKDIYGNSTINYSSEEYITLKDYANKTFYWMACGLGVTFITAYFSYRSGLIYSIASSMPVVFGLLIAEIIVVMVLSSKLSTLSVQTATGLFFAYAVLNGIVFGSYFVIYASSSLFAIFLLTALFFLIMAVYGSATNTDLTTLRPLLVGGVAVLAIFWILAMFIDMTAFERIACTIGVAVFLLFTAYDVQKIKVFHSMFAANPEMAQKSAIYSALSLYLDFINLFINLLRLFGRRRN